MKYSKKENIEKKQLLLKVLGDVISEKRKETNKGILLICYEYDLSSSSLAKLEKGQRDVQITTLWKLSEALGMKFPDFINDVMKRLPKDFKLIDD